MTGPILRSGGSVCNLHSSSNWHPLGAFRPLLIVVLIGYPIPLRLLFHIRFYNPFDSPCHPNHPAQCQCCHRRLTRNPPKDSHVIDVENTNYDVLVKTRQASPVRGACAPVLCVLQAICALSDGLHGRLPRETAMDGNGAHASL
jgi:hypothetical protein